MTTKRPVGRPRQHDDESERQLIFDAAYAALRDRGHDFTVAHILAAAGVATRSFYRHFESKDALLREMYLRDAEWASQRLTKRLAEAPTPVVAVESWIDEIFAFTGNARRAERVAVLGSIAGNRGESGDGVVMEARALLVASLLAAIEAGIDTGAFHVSYADIAAELVAAASLDAAGLADPIRRRVLDQQATTEFCLQALGSTHR